MNDWSRIDRLTSATQTLQAANSGIGHDAGRRPRLQPATNTSTEWCLATFAGRFAEISGSSAGAALTLVSRLVLETQKQGEPVVWISTRKNTFYPPDVADAGIDITALAVIRCPNNIAAARTAEHLLRSGAFGLVVIDVGRDTRLPQHAQSRLAGQARRHHTALICITEKDSHQPSIGSLISQRAHTERLPQTSHHFRCRATVLKDKRSGPGWNYEEICHGPDGLY